MNQVDLTDPLQHRIFNTDNDFLQDENFYSTTLIVIFHQFFLGIYTVKTVSTGSLIDKDQSHFEAQAYVLSSYISRYGNALLFITGFIISIMYWNGTKYHQLYNA